MPTKTPLTATAYADASQLHSLAEFLGLLNDATVKTGWAAPNMIITLGDDDEEIVVGIKHSLNGYVAEIR